MDTDGATPPPPPRDGGVDGGPTGFQVVCAPQNRYTSPRRGIELSGEDRPAGTAVSWRWERESAPPGSVAGPAPTNVRATQFVPDVEGDFVLRTTATDAMGATSGCTFVVHSVVGPPVAICPEQEVVGPAGRPLVVVGDGYDDEGVTAFAWTVVDTPPGAMASVVPADQPSTTFDGSVPGAYSLQLTVTDTDGATGRCVAHVRLTAPPTVVCPAGEVRAPTRQPLTLHGDAMDDQGVTAVRWDLLERPEGSMASPAPADQRDTVITPDRKGRYALRFTATDGDGLTASCDVVVIGTQTPPTAICPPAIETAPLTTIEIMGSGQDDGVITGYVWELVGQPDGSSADPPSPANDARTSFTPDLAGEYTLRFTVIDDDGASASCETPVHAVPREGLRVEMFWNGPPDRSCDQPRPPTPCDDTDVDLHLINGDADRWFSDNDCYFANCDARTGFRRDWYTAAREDDPRLDLDDVNGFGPENINIDRPHPGTYRVGVHFYSDHVPGSGPMNDPPADVVVRIYCGGTTPIATFGPIRLSGAPDNPSDNDFWRVADLAWDGTRCVVTDLTVDGRASIAPATDAQSRR